MSKNKIPKGVIPSEPGMFWELVNWLRLILHLMADERVPTFAKVLPVGTLVYLLNPVDIPGPIDDAAVVGLGLYMFVEMCPPAVVEEHREAIRQSFGAVDGVEISEDDVIDAEFQDSE